MKLNLPHSAIIEFPTGVRDGNVSYTQLPARVAAALEKHQAGNSRQIDDLSTFVVQCAEAPRIGCRLVYHGVTYELRTVKRCTAIDGELVAYRCTV